MTCPHPGSNVQTIRNPLRNRYETVSRIIPVEESLGPLLESFAKAAGRMPRLKRAMLWAPLEYHEQCPSDSWGRAKSNQRNWTTYTPCPAKSLAWGIAYAAPGQPAWDGGESNSPYRQLWWRVGPWRPSWELRRLFQDIGRERWLSQLVEHWTDSQYGNGLVAMDWFEKESFFEHKDGPLQADV